MALEEAICVYEPWWAGYPRCKLLLFLKPLDDVSVCTFVLCAREGENENERETFPTSVSSHGGTVGQGFLVRSVEFMCCSGPGRRAEEGREQKYSARRWDIIPGDFHATSVRWW